ncbi:MAG TPA: hypothetical protein VMJ34_09650 [Bryobacteraceae bacterium]|nr:hypothetical protein [Bryobacteraceae bacterium]
MTESEIVEQLRAGLARAAAELPPDAPMAVDLILPEPSEDEA